MTSKHSFFKYMLQDLRHRIWMIALSALACFLAFPIAYLIWEGNSSKNYTGVFNYQIRYIGVTIDFFKECPMVLGGIIAIVGALIVGIFGFRYVFRKKMVDMYHSLPIKRNKLFWVTYFNGFLIWFVPFVVSLLITAMMACFNVYPIGGMEACVRILGTAAASVGILTVSFLLMYHLVLVAVMLSGNILNTLVCTGIIGASVVSVFGMGVIFLETYMATFYENGVIMERAVYASPLLSGIIQLIMYVADTDGFEKMLFANILVAFLLGAVAWYLYKKRASELAEQGVKNPIATFVMKMVAAVVAGMGGWILFVVLVNSYSTGWGIFGAVLVSVLVYGVLDIIFHMDFKSFFANKLWMAVSTALAVVICLAISKDWMGYDTYLPEADNIEEAAFVVDGYQNHNSYYRGESGGALEEMHVTDTQAIRTLLETGVENLEYSVPYSGIVSYGGISDWLYVRVTLKNGRSYYRQYRVYEKDKEIVWPLICSEEYINNLYFIGEELKEDYIEMRIRREDGAMVEELTDKEAIGKVVEAYNKDVQTNPEAVIAGEGRLLINIRLRTAQYDTTHISVYESMTNTIEVLKNLGYESFLTPISADEVDHIILELGYYSEEYIERMGYTYELLAKERYGLLTEEDYKTIQEKVKEEQSDTALSPEATLEMAVAETEEKDIYITVSDPSEVQELLDVMDYCSPDYSSGTFTKYFIGIRIVDKYGIERSTCIREGELPEKFISRFSELDTK